MRRNNRLNTFISVFPKIVLAIVFLSLQKNINSKPFENLSGHVTSSKSKWVVVLDDPRPERLRGWSGNSAYRGALNYNDDLSLKRLAASVLENISAELVTQWPIQSINVHCLVIAIPTDNQVEIVEKLEADTRVKWVQAYQTFEGRSLEGALPQSKSLEEQKITNSLTSRRNDQIDPYLRLQTVFQQLNIEEVSQVLTGQGITIAMIDSGVEMDHPEIKHAILEQIDFVSSADILTPSEHHGTGIAGVMIAKKGNGKGIIGLAPFAKLFAYRSCWETPSKKTICDSLTLARALDRVAKMKPDLLNLSLTGPKDRLLDSLIDVILKNGTHVVAAYDKSRRDKNRFPTLRAGVSIAQDSFSKTKFSDKTILTPGKEVLTTQPGKTYAFMSGSSIASAHLTSLYALAMQASPEIDLTEFSKLFKNYTQKTNSGNQTDVCAIFLKLKIDIQCSQKFVAQF